MPLASVRDSGTAGGSSPAARETQRRGLKVSEIFADSSGNGQLLWKVRRTDLLLICVSRTCGSSVSPVASSMPTILSTVTAFRRRRLETPVLEPDVRNPHAGSRHVRGRILTLSRARTIERRTMSQQCAWIQRERR